jgi:D-alanyl-D-alanine carboxypeptidase
MNFKEFLKEHKNIIIAGIFSVIVLSIIYFPIKNNKKIETTDQVIESIYKPVLDSVLARSFYVYDILEDKTIFAKDEHLQLPLASIAKLMSGLVVLDILPDTTEITLSRADIVFEGDSGLSIGEKWNLKDLLDFTLITSSNDGMHAISSALNEYLSINNISTIETMNDMTRTLGLNDTIFINETGLDVDNNLSGAYSSAYDVSQLFKKIIKENSDLISNTNRTSEQFISESNIKHTATNTNISINEISNMIASKTGFTNLAGGNLAIVFDAGFMHPIVIVVLGSTIDGRFDDVVKLAKITLEKLSE